jgi:hypothetical protein
MILEEVLNTKKYLRSETAGSRNIFRIEATSEGERKLKYNDSFGDKKRVLKCRQI